MSDSSASTRKIHFRSFPFSHSQRFRRGLYSLVRVLSVVCTCPLFCGFIVYPACLAKRWPKRLPLSSWEKEPPGAIRKWCLFGSSIFEVEVAWNHRFSSIAFQSKFPQDSLLKKNFRLRRAEIGGLKSGLHAVIGISRKRRAASEEDEFSLRYRSNISRIENASARTLRAPSNAKTNARAWAENYVWPIIK